MQTNMTPILEKKDIEEKKAKRLILFLRWMIFIVLMFLFLYSKEKESIKNIKLVNRLLLFFIISNVGLGFVPCKKFLLNKIRYSVFIFDTVFVSVLIYLASGADVELYMAYFLVIFMAALGQSILLSLIITFLISILYGAIVMQTNSIAGMYNTSVLIRIPFLFVVALFSSYFAQEAKKYKVNLRKVENLYGEVKSQLFQSAKLASVGTLASGVIHEIGNLLQIIMGTAESIKRHEGRTEENRKRIKDICEVAEQGGIISRGLLAFSHKGDERYENLDVKRILDESYELVKYNLEKDRVQVIKRYSEEPCSVSVNRNQIKQVIINFMNNARDAMKDGGKLLVTCKTEGEKVIVEFIDEGGGIPDKIRDKVFSPFFTTKEEGGGTGLGLSISRDIMTQHNGTIDFDSREGEGATFRIILPKCV